MIEKDFQTKFHTWIKHKLPVVKEIKNLPETLCFELKIEKGKSFAFNRVAEHQEKALYEASSTGLYHRIQDIPFIENKTFNPKTRRFEKKMRFTKKKPFDCMYIQQARSFVVIWFYRPNKKKEMLWIEIDVFINQRLHHEANGRKSLKDHEWREVADFIFDFE